MVESVRVGIIGDHDPGKPSHEATEAALDHAARSLGVPVGVEWLATGILEERASGDIERFDAFWCAPGSPYESMDGAIGMIRVVRESRKPFIGTCGGFQHVLIEYARNVLGFSDATHAEYDPDAQNLFVTPLYCTLSGQRERIEVLPGSKAHKVYGEPEAEEEYLCNFGLAPERRTLLEKSGLRVSGVDQNDEARVVELPDHDFYVATLFVPQMRSSAGSPHPLVVAFLRAACKPRSRRRSTELEEAR